MLRRVARRGLGRLFVVVLPALTVVAALVGVAVGAAVPAVVVALLLGLVAAWVAVVAVSARARALAERVDRAVSGGAQSGALFDGHEEWQELAVAIDRAAVEMQQRAGELAEERVRSQRLLEELPSAVLLFGGELGLRYANRAARDVFDVAAEADGDARGVLGADVLVDAVDEARELNRQIDVELARGDRLLAARASTLGSGEVVLVVRDVTRARRLDAVRRDFVVNASHELKTPVAGIRALAESLSLALRHNPERAVRMVARMELEAARLARLVRDLLDLARLEELDTAGDRRRVDVVDVVEAQVQRLRPHAERRDITIAVDVGDRAVLVAAPEDVRMIVANLLENAVRYNVDGGSVSVCLTRGSGTLVLEVVDTGVGIPEADRERVFERFYRVDKARSRAEGGTGLGLSLVRHATQRLGGTIGVVSGVDEGSTFRVELPIATG